VPQSPTYPVPYYRSADRPGHHETCTRRGVRRIEDVEMDDDARSTGAPALPDRGSEFRAQSQPGRGRQHEIGVSGRRQADRP
jgi:hypothetical protein